MRKEEVPFQANAGGLYLREVQGVLVVLVLGGAVNVVQAALLLLLGLLRAVSLG